MTRILMVQGHPDGTSKHLAHALAESYEEGAKSAGHEIRHLVIAILEFPFLRSQHDWDHGSLPPSLDTAQADLVWAQHLVLFFPLWLGESPASVKGFFEQVLRPGFAFHSDGKNPYARKGLKGRSARIVCTMGMPASVYRVTTGHTDSLP